MVWTLETHAHADHLSGSPYVKAKTDAKIGIGEHIKEVQKIFRPVFNATDLRPTAAISTTSSWMARRFHRQPHRRGAVHAPGHTPADICYRIGGHVFVGDTLFMPDFGTARADFPGGDVRTLYRSIRKLLALPPETVLHLCHDYKAPGRDVYAWETTVGEQRERNVHVKEGVSEEEFTAMRTARDATAGRAAPSSAVDPGQYPRRQVSPGGSEWRSLPDHSGQTERRSGTRRLTGLIGIGRT